MKAYQQIEEKARQLVSAREADNMEDAIHQVVAAHPDLYRKSLEEGMGSELSSEVSATLANLSESDRAIIERKAAKIYLSSNGLSQDDAYVKAMMETPDLHGKCIEASSASISYRHGKDPLAVAITEGVYPEMRAGQSHQIVTAAASLITAGDAPSEIVFIPEGLHKIFPLSDPKGVTINLPPDKGIAVAARLNAQLQERLGQNVHPWFDIEHTRKFPASGYPKSFRYEPGKGIMAAVEWSGSGRKAIENKDVRYFSPEFFIDENGVPSGLPERGPIGGLVTEPAFREIQPIAAGLSADETSEEDAIA